jgi:lysyl-tRNA synthetase, class II
VKATLAGRIRSMRPKGKLTFAHIEDGDGKVQLFLRVNEVGGSAILIFSTGCSTSVILSKRRA